MTDTNTILNDLLVRSAVMERLLFDVTGSLIAESHDPAEVFSNVIAQLRNHFDPEAAPSEEMRIFLDRAGGQIDRIEKILSAAAFPVSEH